MKLIFKHSKICPISNRVKLEVDKFVEEYNSEVEFEMIDVISDRKRSDEVESAYGINHESPQVILLDDSGSVIWNGSHFQVTSENLIKNFRKQ